MFSVNGGCNSLEILKTLSENRCSLTGLRSSDEGLNGMWLKESKSILVPIYIILCSLSIEHEDFGSLTDHGLFWNASK